MTKRKLIQFWFCHRVGGLYLAGAGLLALSGIGRGQEALRGSMAGDVMAATFQQANSSLGYYNLLLGPTAWRFSSALDLEYNSNVQLESNGSGDSGDIIIRPSVNTMMHWPFSLKNSLDITLNAGYSEYLEHPDLSQFFVTPGSGLSFDVYVSDFKINLHDRISISQEAYENAGASGGNQNLTSLQNSAGTSVAWELNKGIANLGYDHDNYTSLSSGSQGQQQDASSDNIFVNSGIRVRPELLLGVEAGGSVFTYSQNSSANAAATPGAVQWSAGVFGSAKISDHLDVRLDVGYTVSTPDSTSTNLVVSDNSGYYFSLSLSHRVNQRLNYTLSVGRSSDLVAYGQQQSMYYARFTPSWNPFQKYSISTPLWWQQGTQVYGTKSGGGGNYQQIGLGLTVSRKLTQKLSASLGYRFIEETADQAGLAYTENIVDLNFSYQF